MTTPRESMRTVFGKALTTLGLELPNLVVLDADNHVSDVMAQGTWHLRNGAVLRRGPFEKTSVEDSAAGHAHA